VDKLERLKQIIERKLANAKKQKIKSLVSGDSYDTGYEQGRINLCEYFLDEIKEIEKL
jgi:hypothetical protein